MASNIAAASFRNNTSGLPGIHRPQDAYHWLENSDDEDNLLTRRITHVPRNAYSFKPSTASSPTPTDLRNGNGKRGLHTNSYDPTDQGSKKMRIENKQREATASNSQVKPCSRPTTIDLSGSPPPMRRNGNSQEHKSNDQLQRRGIPKIATNPHSKQPAVAPRMSNGHRPATGSPMLGQWLADQHDIRTLAPSEARESVPAWKRLDQALRTRRERAPQPVTLKAMGPFQIDDSSDEEDYVKVQPAPQSKPQKSEKAPGGLTSCRTTTGSIVQTNMADRERQLVESRKRRQEAAERKRDTPSSSGAQDEDGGKVKGEMDIDTFVDNVPAERAAAKQVAHPRLQHRRKNPSPTKNSMMDLTNLADYYNKALPSSANRQPLQPSNAVQRQKKIDDEDQRAKQLAEVKRRRAAELRARAQALDETKKKEAEAREAAEAKQRAEEAEEDRVRANLQAEHELQVKNRAEAAQRSRAIVEAQRKVEAQKTLDAQKEAEAKEEEQQKRRLEEQKWEDRRKAKAEQREALRKRQAEAEKERNVLADRESALAKLSAVRPPQPVQKTKPPAAGNGAETNINDVAAKHTAPQGLHFKDGGDGSIAADAARKKVKEIQEQNRSGGPSQTREPEQERQMTEKHKRIRRTVERNLRMREAEEKEAGGPQSLSSAAGQALLAHASSAKPGSERPNSSFRPKSRTHGRQLGEILPEDVQLVRWRDTGMRFQDISTLWPKTFGVSRAHETLRGRYKQVKEALKSAGVHGEEALLDRVQSDHADARVELNRSVHGEWPPPTRAREQPPPRARDVKGHVLPGREQNGRGSDGVAKPKIARSLTASFGSSTTEGTLAHEDEPAARPQTGGKSWGPEAFQYYLEGLVEAMAEEDAADTALSRENSPMGEDDYCHFIYQVQRREMTKEDIDQGFLLEEDPWQVCDEPLDDLARANAKAGNEALVMPKKWRNMADSDRDHDYQARTLDNGRKIFTVNWEGVGRVQTTVVRAMRYHQDGILPSSKDGRAPKTVWHVRERTIVKSGVKGEDELFEEKSETDTTVNIDSAVYTTLEQANLMAIRHFVSIAFSPTSANYNQREVEVRAAEKSLEEELEEMDGDEDGEGPVFEREIEDEDGKRWVRVWVEEGELRGPRNL